MVISQVPRPAIRQGTSCPTLLPTANRYPRQKHTAIPPVRVRRRNIRAATVRRRRVASSWNRHFGNGLGCASDATNPPVWSIHVVEVLEMSALSVRGVGSIKMAKVRPGQGSPETRGKLCPRRSFPMSDMAALFLCSAPLETNARLSIAFYRSSFPRGRSSSQSSPKSSLSGRREAPSRSN